VLPHDNQSVWELNARHIKVDRKAERGREGEGRIQGQVSEIGDDGKGSLMIVMSACMIEMHFVYVEFNRT